MHSIQKFIEDNEVKVKKYTIKGKVLIVETDHGCYVFKDKTRNFKDNKDIYDYLDSRSFNYYPKILSDNKEFVQTEYIPDKNYSKDQKIQDIMELVSLLHSKTTHYKEIDLDDYKRIYEDIKNNVSYLTSYYNDYMNIIDSHVIMSPSEYLLARNISIIFEMLYFCDQEIDKWYDLIKGQRKVRQTIIHNNLRLEHFRRNTKSYLISWDKARIDIPVFDIYKFYRRYSLNYDFSYLLKKYEKNYPLQDNEKLLLFTLISLPKKLEFSNNEYKNSVLFAGEIDYLYKTYDLVLPQYHKKTKKENTHK